MPGSQVLVVEADSSVRKVLADILAREGVEVSLAGDGPARARLAGEEALRRPVYRACGCRSWTA